MLATLHNDALDACLFGRELEIAWRECLEAYEDGTPEQRAACQSYAAGRRGDIATVLRDITDPAEREAAAAVCYISLKSEWILLNTQGGYQVASGKLDGSLFCRAGMISALLGALEPLLGYRDLDRITDFLSQPVDGGAVEGFDLAAVLGGPARHRPNDEIAAPTPGAGPVAVDPVLLEAHITALNQKIAKMEADHRRIADELGYSDPDAIIAMFHRLESRVRPGEGGTATPDPAASESLRAVESERDAWREEALALREAVAAAQTAAAPASLLPPPEEGTDDEVLYRCFGTYDVREVVARHWEVQAQLESLRDVADMLGNMEQALQSLS
jgi:hypothetical protein